MQNLLRLPVLVSLLAVAAPAPGQVTEATVEVGRLPSAVVYDSIHHKLYVAIKNTNSVAVVDTTNRVTKTILVGSSPSALCWNPVEGKVYCANDILVSDGSVSIISTATDSVIATVGVGENPLGLVWSSAGNKVYCMNSEGRSVTVIGGTNNQVLTSLGLSQRANRILYNPVSNRVYVTSGGFQQTGRVTVIDCADDDIVATLSTGNNANAFGLAHNPGNNRLYVTNAGAGNLRVINCNNNQGVGTLAAGVEPKAVAWTTNNKVFWASYWDHSTRWMPGDSARIKRTVTLSGGPAAMLYNPVTTKLFAACPLESKVIVLDCRDQHELAVITEIETGSGPEPMALSAARNRVYVANSWGSTVTVLRDAVGIAEPEEPGAAPAVATRALPSPAPRGARVTFAATGFTPARLEIRDALGRKVHQTTAGPNSSWTAAAPGIYFYTLSAQSGRNASGKLVVD